MSDVLITEHYEVWDEEALEAGEANERGTERENEPATWKEAIRTIQDGGPWEPSSMPLSSGRDWLSTADPEINYRTGEHTSRSLHFRRPDGSLLSLHQIRRLYRAAGVEVR